MERIGLPFGSGTAELIVPEGNSLSFIAPGEEAPVADIRSEIRRSLSAPYGTEPLSRLARGVKRVVLLCDDWTRPTPASDILAPLIFELQKSGVGLEGITLLVARGERPLVEGSNQLLEDKFGCWYHRLKFIVHDCDDHSKMKFIGISDLGTPVWVNREVTDAQLVIGIGNVVPHIAAGFAGGAKILMPGVCARETIESNHRIYFSPQADLGKLSNNPFRKDINQIAGMIGLDMIINTVLNADGSLVKSFTGDYQLAFQKAVKLARKIYSFPVQEQFDISVVVPGFGYDIDLADGTKALFPADRITRPGGVIVLLIDCREGIGWPGFMGLMKKKRSEVVRAFIRREITDTVAPHVFEFKRMQQEKEIIVVTEGVSPQELAEMGFSHTSSLEEAMSRVFASRKGGSKVGVLSHGVVMLPEMVGG